jgi:hypothetical protein
MLGDRQLFQKFGPYEGSAHVPLIICGPGIAPGSASAVPASTWDVAATIAELSQTAFPSNHPWAGKSLMGDTDESKIICYHHGGDPAGFSPVITRYVAAVGQGHKFIHYYNGGEEELYDLKNDPWEQKNVLSMHEKNDIAQKLRRACIDFELTQGQADRIQDGRFVDQPYAKPSVNIGKYFGLRFTQNPRWLAYRDKKDFEAVIREMMACLDQDGVFIPASDEWKKEAESIWRKSGGDLELLNKFFAAVESR